MKSFQRVILTSSLVCGIAVTPGYSLDLWPFGKKEAKQAPPAQQLQAQDAEAAALLASADQSSNPLKIYRQITEKYPFTVSAATSQYRLAAALEADGQSLKAFEEYQVLIDNYKSSTQFTKALDSQFAIAQKAREDKLTSILGVVKRKTGPEETIKLFRAVVNNAPQGRNAPAAAFEIARIHEQDNAVAAAVEGYKDVADQYPRHPLAIDAQKRVAELNLGRIEAGERDSGALLQSRAAANQLSLSGSKLTDEAMLLQDQITEAQAESSYKIGKFYDKQGKYKSAIIYYSDVLKLPGSVHFQEVKDRVSELSSKDPTLLSKTSTKISDKQLAVKAETDTKSRPDYLGPPRPMDVTKRMRTGTDTASTIPIAPIEEAALPDGLKTAPDSSLLTPAAPAADLPKGAMADKTKSTEIAEPVLPTLDGASPPPAAEPAAPAVDAPAVPAPPAPPQ